jgi:PAS domain S-box-containing protein
MTPPTPEDPQTELQRLKARVAELLFQLGDDTAPEMATLLHSTNTAYSARLNHTLEVILRQAAQLAGTSHGYVDLLDEAEQVMRPHVSHGVFNSSQGRAFPQGKGISGQVWQTGEPVVINDYQKWPHRTWHGHEPPIQSVVALPLKLDGRITGVIGLASDDPAKRFTQHNVEMLQSFADLGSLALENARLHDALQASRNLTDQITRAIPDGVYVINTADFSLLFENPALAAIMGRDKPYDEVNDTEIEQVTHPDDLPKLQQMIEALHSGAQETFAGVEYRVKRSDGTWRWLRTRETVLRRDESGQPAQILGITQDISDSKEMELALRESETRLRTIFDAAAVGICITGADGHIRDANPALCDMLGYTLAELQATHFETFTDPAFHELERALVMRLVNGEEDSVSLEKRYIHKDGTYFWVRLQASIVAIEGEQVGLVIVEDIDDRKQTEEALQHSEARFRALIEQSSDIVAVTDSDLNVRYASPAVVRILGYDQDAYLNEPVTRVIHDDSRDALEAAIAQARANPGVPQAPAEYRIRSRDGSYRYLETIIQNRLDDPAVAGFILNIRDITDRKHAELALRDSETRFRTLVETLDAVVFIYQNEQVIYVNTAATRILGYERERLEGDGFTNAIHPDSREAITAAFRTQQTISKTQSDRQEIRVITADGKTRWFDIQLAQVTLEGEPALLGTALDITERKNAEQHRLALHVEQERVQMIARFVRDVSHDFRTPLATINTSLFLMENNPDVARRAHHATIIRGQVEQIATMVDTMLTMTRLDSGEPLQLDSVDTRELVDQIKTSVEGLARVRGQTIAVTHHEPVPVILGDESQLFQALRHLADNAVRYTSSGGEVHLITRSGQGEVIVEVHDTGMGIPENEQGRIFERFYRVNEARTASGLGLGLPIAHKIIENHGGHIEIESVPGRGSIFRVHLPVPVTD